MQTNLESDESAKLDFHFLRNSLRICDRGNFAWLRDQNVEGFVLFAGVIDDDFWDLCCLWEENLILPLGNRINLEITFPHPVLPVKTIHWFPRTLSVIS